MYQMPDATRTSSYRKKPTRATRRGHPPRGNRGAHPSAVQNALSSAMSARISASPRSVEGVRGLGE